MSEQETVVDQETAEVTETAQAKPEKKPARILPMNDGTTCNFGSRASLISSINEETNTISFKIAFEPVGQIITWIVEGLEYLQPLHKKVYLYGLMERVKSSLAPVKLADLPEAINKQIATINSGEFNIRSVEGEDGEVSLTLLQQAFALVKSNPELVVVAKPEWANLDDVAVITDILNFWEGLDAASKRAVRNDPFVKMRLAELEVAKQAESEVKSAI